MNAARDAILERVRSSLAGGAPPSAVARTYRRAGSRTRDERVDLFCERAREYRADVRRVSREAVSPAAAAVCRELGLRRLAVPPGLPAAWRPADVELLEDRGLTPRELDAVDGVLTGATLAIAETGTIVLGAGERDGRRALTLVPDVHICVVEQEHVVELVPEAFARLAVMRTPLTFVSGPSATSDIELSRVEGVHGPRTLVVLLAS